MKDIPQVGQNAPSFSAPDQNGNWVSLDNFTQTWLVLYFYPKDNTPGCTTEAKEFSELKEEFDALGATVLGVSPDSEKSHSRFIAKHDLAITLLCDPDRKLAEAYGVWQLKKFMGKEYMGVVRSTFLISPDKTLARVWTKVKAKGHARDVLEQLRQLIAIDS